MDKIPPVLSSVVPEFAKLAHLLQEASYEVRRRRLSAYPLFVRCEEAPNLGVCLIALGEQGATAHYYASSLEELNKVGLVEDTETFSKSYKDPDQYCCLLLVELNEVQFVYLPYPEEN